MTPALLLASLWASVILVFEHFLTHFAHLRDHLSMGVDKVLNVYVNNIGTVVEWLFIIVLLLFVPILYFAFRKKGTETTANLEGIEDTLKKVLEATRNQPVASSLPQDSAVAGAANAAPGTASAAGGPDLSAIKAQVAEREKKIAELNSKIAELEQAKSEAGPSGDVAGYEARIKDLESRLQEYEIIEDDIANLSLYKEENARLKNELTQAKTGQTAKVEEIVTPKAEELAISAGLGTAPAASTADEQAFQDALNAQPPVVGGSEIDTAAEQEILGPLNDAVAKLGGDAPAASAPEDDFVSQLANVMGEPAAAPASTPAPPTPAAAPAAPAPVTPAPTAATPVPEEGPEALKSFDPDKIMAEADQLASAPVDTSPEEEGDPGQKLIDEFENFMKDNS